jgi:hypothetical protein
VQPARGRAGRTLIGSAAHAFATWDALRFLREQAQREPLTAQPALDSIIQRHWDRWDRDGTRSPSCSRVVR